MSNKLKRQEAQKRREHQLGHEYGANSRPSFGEHQQISKNPSLRDRLQMCLGNYDDAQETLSSIGMDSLVGTETVPTTPVIDPKQNVFSMSDHSRHHLSKERSIPKIAKISSKAGSSHSHGHPHAHHQRHSLHSSQQQRSSISPKFNSQMNSSGGSQPDNKIRQTSPVSKPAKPAAPRPPSRHENKPKHKEKPHQHMSKERPSEKEKHRPPHAHQEKDKIQVHQKTSKPVHRLPAVKTEQPSLQEEAQVKHMEFGKPFVNEKQHPVHGTQSSSVKSPHNKPTTVKAVSATNSIPAIAKPTKMATPKPPPPPSPTVRTTLEQTIIIADSQRSPKPDKDITDSIPPVDSSAHKKSKEKKLKKKKHKSKLSPSPELVKDSASNQPAPSNSELNASRPKLSLHMPSKKPVAQKPSSLDLSNIKVVEKVQSPILSPFEDVSQDTMYLQKIFDEMAGSTSPVLTGIQTPCKTSSFTFAFPHSGKATSKEQVLPSSTTAAASIRQQEEAHQYSITGNNATNWNLDNILDESAVSVTGLPSLKRNLQAEMEQEMMAGMMEEDENDDDRHDSSSSDSSSGSDSEDDMPLSAKSDRINSIGDLDLGTVLDTITPLRPNPAFSFPLVHDDVAQLEPPTLEEDNLSHFVMAPQLTGLASLAKPHDSDADSSSSGSEGSSSEDDSSDSEADNDDLFTEDTTAIVMGDQSRILQQTVSSLSTQLTATPESVPLNNMNSLASSAPAAVNRQSGTSMKRLRNMKTMLASYVKAPDAAAAKSNTGARQSQSEVSTPVAPCTLDTTKDNAVPSIATTEPLNSENRKRLKSVESPKSNAPIQPLPRKGSNSKRMTSFSSTMEAGMSEDSSSDSEGEESGEVTNSDSEDEAAKPKSAKLAKWDNSSTQMPAKSSSPKGKSGLELRISISRQYYTGRSLPTPVTTPKSPPMARIRPIVISAPEKKSSFRDRTNSEDYSTRCSSSYSQQPRDSPYSHRRHSRSMRSSSPDHHHQRHHSSGSRHREPPPPRGSSHWNHGWSGGGDHHYPYDYDYSGSSSHHYPRKGRHSAPPRLSKPEIYMEDAKKLKHSGDRMSSVVEKAQMYLEAALTYMLYCASKEDEGDPDKDVMLTTILLLKHIVQSHSGGLNMLTRGVYCEMLSVLCLRCHSVLCMKVFQTTSNNESVSRNQKVLSEFFSAKNIPQGRSPFLGTSPCFSPANSGSGTGVTTSGVDYSVSCHSPSASNVSIPGHIFSIAVSHLTVTSHLFHAQDSWRQADSISEQTKDFFDTLDRRNGPISQHSSLLRVVEWAREGLQLLKSKSRDY
ncbi:AF4/FMR2 family member 4-like isoform X2 [Dysidea avara]|uniref:AF4/FMR2 family member 4-like isoform X2 n=1 Tax=Dysidea avara TaxID=196820 RepID=UPI00331B6B4D